MGTPLSPLSAQALAAHGGHVLPGDEIVQVNEQVVVSGDGGSRVLLGLAGRAQAGNAGVMSSKKQEPWLGKIRGTQELLPGGFGGYGVCGWGGFGG